MKVSNEIGIYEKDDKDILGGDGPIIKIESHWNDNHRINIIIGKTTYTVIAAQLRAAINNATIGTVKD